MANLITTMIDKAKAAQAAAAVPSVDTSTLVQTGIWDAIPTWVKILGAGGVAFLVYKLLLAPKPKQLSGARRRR